MGPKDETDRQVLDTAAFHNDVMYTGLLYYHVSLVSGTRNILLLSGNSCQQGGLYPTSLGHSDLLRKHS